jgi:hypothetical protein
MMRWRMPLMSVTGGADGRSLQRTGRGQAALRGQMMLAGKSAASEIQAMFNTPPAL